MQYPNYDKVKYYKREHICIYLPWKKHASPTTGNEPAKQATETRKTECVLVQTETNRAPKKCCKVVIDHRENAVREG
jgi:hypothetical protein